MRIPWTARITFLPRSKRLLILWLQSPSAVILEPPKIKSATVSTVSQSISHPGRRGLVGAGWGRPCPPRGRRTLSPPSRRYSAEAQALDHRCSCCREQRTSQREVALQCPGGRTLRYMGNKWGNSGNSVRLYFSRFQNHCRW